MHVANPPCEVCPHCRGHLALEYLESLPSGGSKSGEPFPTAPVIHFFRCTACARQFMLTQGDRLLLLSAPATVSHLRQAHKRRESSGKDNAA
jgi:hypothetical protein